jgi:hypothetical protein
MITTTAPTPPAPEIHLQIFALLLVALVFSIQAVNLGFLDTLIQHFCRRVNGRFG